MGLLVSSSLQLTCRRKSLPDSNPFQTLEQFQLFSVSMPVITEGREGEGDEQQCTELGEGRDTVREWGRWVGVCRRKRNVSRNV